MFDAAPPCPLLPLAQSPGYARAMARLGVEVEELTFSTPQGIAGHAMIQTRRWPGLGRLGLISRGPVWCTQPGPRLLEPTISALRHPVVLNADGMAPEALRAAGFFQIMTGATIARLDLSGDVSIRRGRMHQKWRNRLTNAEAGPLRVGREKMPADPKHWLLRAEEEQRRMKRYRALPTDFVVAFTKANPRQAQLFTATLHGETIAGMLFLRHGPNATYHIGHTTEAGRKHHAHTLILARAADWLAEQGVAALELGPVDTVKTPGLARFKLGSGATAHVLGGTWLYSRKLAPLARRLG
jgi:hypothetical protein